MSLYLLGTYSIFIHVTHTLGLILVPSELCRSDEIFSASLSASSDLCWEKILILHSEFENMKGQLFLAAETFASEPTTPFMDIFLNLTS
jgi:hypothetical protein